MNKFIFGILVSTLSLSAMAACRVTHLPFVSLADGLVAADNHIMPIVSPADIDVVIENGNDGYWKSFELRAIQYETKNGTFRRSEQKNLPADYYKTVLKKNFTSKTNDRKSEMAELVSVIKEECAKLSPKTKEVFKGDTVKKVDLKKGSLRILASSPEDQEDLVLKRASLFCETKGYKKALSFETTPSNVDDYIDEIDLANNEIIKISKKKEEAPKYLYFKSVHCDKNSDVDTTPVAINGSEEMKDVSAKKDSPTKNAGSKKQ